MNFKNSVGFIVAIAVCVVIFASCLVPAVMSVTEEKATYRNTGSYFATAGGEDTHTIVVSASGNTFIITTDGKTDRTPSFGTYNPGGVRTASAIAIGVYGGNVNTDGLLVSQAGKTYTTNESRTTLTDAARNGNIGNTVGTYEILDYLQYRLYTIMGLTVLGSMNMETMMGPGINTLPSETGLKNTAYSASTDNTDVVNIFIESAYGQGFQTKLNNVLVEGSKITISNVLGGLSIGSEIKANHIIEYNSMPTSTGYFDTVLIDDELSLIPLTVTNDTNEIGRYYFDSGSNRGIRIGPNSSFLSMYASRSIGGINAEEGARLTYVMTDYTPTSTDYGYVITFNEGGNEITGVQALVEGVLTDKNPTGTTLNSYWDFDSETGIGPFGSYYAAINLSDGANTDDETEARLSTQKGAVGYILDPTDWTKTLAGTSYTSGEYNIMLIIPTVYWGVNDGKLYMSNSPDTFSSVEGLEMAAYAHTYTVDPAVDTKNPMTTSSASLAIGEDSIVRLYETGDVYIIKSNGMTKIGQASGDNTVTFTITGTTLGYTINNVDYTEANYLAYIADKGNYVYAQNPFVVPDTDIIIIGGYAYDLEVKDGDDVNDLVDIGYCASGVMDSESENYLAVTATLNPVSNHGYTVTETDITVNLTEVKTNLNQVNSVLFTTAWDDSGTDKGDSVATYTYFLVPEEIHYSNPSFVENSMWIVLLILVGTISIVAVVVAIVRGMED